MSTKFKKVSEKQWRYSGRKKWNCTSFEEIVDCLGKTIKIYSLVRSKLKYSTEYHRVNIKVKAPEDLVNAFHSSEFGYRAQFYSGIEIGESANNFVVKRLMPILLSQIEEIGKSTCRPDWALQSLSLPASKIWIHQGIWLRKKPLKMRRLTVDRWLSHSKSLDKKVRKKVIWSTLVPNEDKLDIKGGFICSDGTPLKYDLKPCRSKQLFHYGFT